MKVTIKSWTGVAIWRWIANDDNCGICRMPFDASCPDCKIPGDDCPLESRRNLFHVVSRKTPKHALYVKAWEARRGTDPSLVKCRRVSATARDIDRRVPVGDNAADTRAGAPAVLLPRPRPRPAVPIAYRCTYTRNKRTVRPQTLPPRRQVRVASRNSGSRRAGAARRRREINLTRDRRRFISPLPCSSLGAVLALFPHTLHHEVAALAADQPHLPDVSPGVEVQGVTADAFRTGPQVSARSEQSGEGHVNL